MKLLKYDTESFDGQLISSFRFDKLSACEDVIKIVDAIRSCGINIESLTAMEFGDYDDDKKIITYTNMDKIGDLVKDFQNIYVETYNMHGKCQSAEFIASVYPNTNTFSIRYDAEIQKAIEDCVLNHFK